MTEPSSDVPESRINSMRDEPASGDRAYVLYWMTVARRTRSHWGLQRAVDWSRELGRPLLVFEPLRAGYQWAADRHHRFVIDGMADNLRACLDVGVPYYPYLEPEPGAGKGLLAKLAERAGVVVGDEYPAFFLPRMAAAAAEQVECRFELVDTNGLLPLRAADRVHKTAHSFRRHLQNAGPDHLERPPLPEPLRGLPDDLVGQTLSDLVADDILGKWAPAFDAADAADAIDVADFPIDHDVPPAEIRGGARAARKRLEHWLEEDAEAYADERKQPLPDRSSQLSPYLHFGHLGTWEVLDALAERHDWSPDDLGDERQGARKGFWNMSEAADAFLDELITWREVGFNFCHFRDDFDLYESLPDWAQETLAEHADDERPHVYSLEQFETAATHEPIWNAAQNQLRSEGRIHNYLRMVWGKKILHWSESPLVALEIMIELNNKYALDGRDPNSYSGIFWCLGRFDRAWGPEREVFGKIRYMTCANTARKLDLGPYLDRFAPADGDATLF